MKKFDYIFFFDVDNSIYNSKTKFLFLEYFFLETLPSKNYASHLYEKFIKKYSNLELNGECCSNLNRLYYENFCGMSCNLLTEISISWFKIYCQENLNLFFESKFNFELKMHKNNNAQIVILSSLFMPCLKPILELIPVHEVICTELEIVNEFYTGKIICDPISLYGKSLTMEKFLKKNTSHLLFDNNKCEVKYSQHN